MKLFKKKIEKIIPGPKMLKEFKNYRLILQYTTHNNELVLESKEYNALLESYFSPIYREFSNSTNHILFKILREMFVNEN